MNNDPVNPRPTKRKQTKSARVTGSEKLSFKSSFERKVYPNAKNWHSAKKTRMIILIKEPLFLLFMKSPSFVISLNLGSMSVQRTLDLKTKIEKKIE